MPFFTFTFYPTSSLLLLPSFIPASLSLSISDARNKPLPSSLPQPLLHGVVPRNPFPLTQIPIAHLLHFPNIPLTSTSSHFPKSPITSISSYLLLPFQTNPQTLHSFFTLSIPTLRLFLPRVYPELLHPSSLPLYSNYPPLSFALRGGPRPQGRDRVSLTFRKNKLSRRDLLRCLIRGVGKGPEFMHMFRDGTESAAFAFILGRR